jgi:hypothetical protein
MLAIPATATYRRFQSEQDWTSVRQIQLLANFQHFLNDESVLELRNAALLIEATQRSANYEYGAGYWNHLVFRFIPAQILGDKFKQSLMLHASRDGVERELAAFNYVNPPGSTVTGLGDSFQQFGYLGCLVFALLAWFFTRLWSAATLPSHAFAQLLYIQSCTSAMRAVTHWTLDFLPGFIYSAAFLGLAAWYARSSHSPHSPHSPRSPQGAFPRPSLHNLSKAARGQIPKNPCRRVAPRRPLPQPQPHPRAGSPHRFAWPYLPKALATMKIRTAPPSPPPSKRYRNE